MEDTNTSTSDEQRVLMTWQASVIPKHTRTKRWYTIAGIIVLIFAAYGIITASWAFTIVVILCAGMYYLIRDHVPPLKTITLTNKGAQLEDKFIRWQDISGFWILSTPEYSELHFVPKIARKSDIIIQTGDQDLQTLHTTIGSFIPELTEKRESFLDALLRTAKL